MSNNLILTQLQSKLDSFADALIVNSSFCNSLGMQGKIGAAIFFYELYITTKKNKYQLIADKLIDEIYNYINVSGKITSCINHGLIGIGIGLAKLYNMGYVKGSPNEIFSDLDKTILRKEVKDKIHMLFYLCKRLEMEDPDFLNEESTLFFLRQSLSDASGNHTIEASQTNANNLVYYLDVILHFARSQKEKSILVSNYLSDSLSSYMLSNIKEIVSENKFKLSILIEQISELSSIMSSNADLKLIKTHIEEVKRISVGINSWESIVDIGGSYILYDFHYDLDNVFNSGDLDFIDDYLNNASASAIEVHEIIIVGNLLVSIIKNAQAGHKKKSIQDYV